MMPHVDPDRLAQLALGEPSDGEPDGVVHVDACPDCRADLDSLVDMVARLGESTIRPADVTPPPERIWRAIAAELAESSGTVEPAAAPTSPVTALASRRAGRRRPWRLVAVAAVAALCGIAGTFAVTGILHDATVRPSREVALAPLSGGPQGVAGHASITPARAADELAITTSGLDDTQPGFYEVWVIDPDDLTRMYSVGALDADAGGRFTMPANVDLDRYAVVDVSIEPEDGNPAHSTHSVLRGTLPTEVGR
jgi:anti-sigma-K factor RskA